MLLRLKIYVICVEEILKGYNLNKNGRSYWRAAFEKIHLINNAKKFELCQAKALYV